jgi:hypothetical protein
MSADPIGVLSGQRVLEAADEHAEIAALADDGLI